MSALLGTFVAIKTMADGTPRITLDLQCSLAEVAALGLMPGIAFGIARITNESSTVSAQPESRSQTPSGVEISDEVTDLRAVSSIRPKGGDLARMAGVFCNDPVFWEFLENKFVQVVPGPDMAAIIVRLNCGIDSRSELDHNIVAAGIFHNNFRVPFLAFKEARK